MIKVAYMNISLLYDEAIQQKNMDRLSQSRRQKAEKIKVSHERARSIGAGLLLERMLSEAGVSEDIEYLEYGVFEHGKPYLVKYGNIHFNLSHSGDYVACAISDQNVGIDIQKMDKMRENVAKRFFSKNEQEFLGMLEDERKQEAFFKIWTGKESYTKWLETGLTIPLNEFSIDVEKKKVTGKIPCNLVYCNELLGYSICVAVENAPDEITFEKINLL